MAPTLPPREQLCQRYCSNEHTHPRSCVRGMGRLVHPGLGSSSLVAHVLYYLPPREQLCNRSCSNTGTHTFRRPSTTWVTRDRSGARYSGLHGKHADVLGCCRAARLRGNNAPDILFAASIKMRGLPRVIFGRHRAFRARPSSVSTI